MNNYDEIIDAITVKQDLESQVLDIVKNAGRKINAIEIIREMKDNFTSDELKNVIGALEHLCSEGILKSYSGNTYKLNDLLVGKVDLHEKGNAHIILEGQDDVFIPRDRLKGANDKDLVSIEITNKERNEGKVVKILKRSLGSNVAEIINNDGEVSFKLYGEDKIPYEVMIEDTDINLVDGLLVHLDYVKDINSKTVLAKIDSVLGHKNALLNEGQEPTEVSGEIVKIACEYSLRLEFPEEVKEEARNMPKSLTEEMIEEGFKQNREDFRNDIVVTIDDKDTKDIDDAISVKILPNGNYELAVHIADVSYYVKPGSALWKEAQLRANSNYLGNKVIPMLPVELSNGICSLNPNEDRFTTSCIMEIDHSGNVINSRISKGIIKSKKKMNYDAVQDIIDNKDTEDTKGYRTLPYISKKGDNLDKIAFENNVTTDELLEYNKDLIGKRLEEGTTVNVPCRAVIKNMNALSKVISAFKERRGELKFVSDESKIYQDENDKVIDIVARDQRPAERIIEDFMVAANEQVAAFLEEYNIATYRIHDKPLEMKITEFMKLLELLGIHYPNKFSKDNISSKDCQKILEYLEDKEMFKVLSKKMLRCMQKAIYSTENIGHFGIASPRYTHFTSPIRRFDDLLNHTSIGYILEDYSLQENFIKSWNAYLTTMCEYISEQERNSEKCEYAVDDMLKAYYMEDHVGEEYDATIDGLMPSAFFVQTDNYIDGRVDIIQRDENDYVGLNSSYDYNENLMAYTKGGKVAYRYGDKVRVVCVGADHEKRQVDFALVRKL